MSKTKRKTETTYLQMDVDLKADIVEMAEADDRTLTSMITVLLKGAVAERKRRPPQKRRRA